MNASRLSYVYRIFFEDGSWYWGSRLCPSGVSPEEDKYVGSPITHRAKWELESFTKEIIEVFSEHSHASDLEVSLIKKDLNKNLCLNENAGGVISRSACIKGGQKSAEKSRGKKRSKEIREKISNAKKGKKFSEAHIKALKEAERPSITEEVIKKRVATRKGYQHSEETKQKIGQSQKGKVIPQTVREQISKTLLGSSNSPETRKKISEANFGKVWWNNGFERVKSAECPGEGWFRGMKLKANAS